MQCHSVFARKKHTLSAHIAYIASIFWEQVNLDGLSWRKKWINGRERRIRDFPDILQVENLPNKSFIHFEVSQTL